MLNSTLNPILQTAIADVYNRLNNFIEDPLFTTNLISIFGQNAAHITPKQFLNFVHHLPKIEIQKASNLQGALGAFSAQTNTIYLSDSLVNSSQSNQLTAVLLEEIGHYLDSRLNKVDTKGDEGELFSAVVRGVDLSPTELTRIQNENDQAQIVLDGKLLTVEQAQNPYFSVFSLGCNATFLSGSTIVRIVRFGYAGVPSNPQISGNNVVWVGDPFPPGRWNSWTTDVYLWNSDNISNAYVINGTYYGSGWNVGDLAAYDISPNISGNNLVWYSKSVLHGAGSSGVVGEVVKLYFWNSGTDTAIEIASSVSNTNAPPQISGNNVAWVSKSGNDDEIYFWNGSTTIQLTNNNVDDNTPKISGNNVVWRGFDGNDYEIYFWNGSTTTQVTNNSTDDTDIQISGNNAVWRGFDGNDYEIYFWNGKTTTQLTNNSTDDKEPQISGNNVVWQGLNGLDQRIYFWDGSTTIQVSQNTTYNSHPQISGNNVVWLEVICCNYSVNFWNGVSSQILMKPPSTVFSLEVSENNVLWGSLDGNLYYQSVSNGSFTATSQTDLINADDGDDAVFTSFANLQQNDRIDGGIGIDTLIITEGTNSNNITINANNIADQLVGITGTTISNFERFDFGKFLGSVTFNGSTGDDWIKSGLGSDRLSGGKGNDTYILDSIHDVVIENLNEGKDLVQSTVNTTLTDNVEDLTLLGTTNINGTGNNSDNTITGNSGNNLLKGLSGNDNLSGAAGNDILVGAAGSDRLTGGDGADQFLFGSGVAFNAANFGVDTITDFAKGSDKVVLSKASFNKLISVFGNLQSSEFTSINSAVDELPLVSSSSAKIVYNQTTGNLFYNPDGTTSGLTGGGQFATFNTPLNLTVTDFLVQA